MRVQVIDIRRRRSGVRERGTHRLDRPVAIRWRIGDPVARQRIAVAGELGVDSRAAAARRGPFLEHQKAGAFAKEKAVARRIERPASRCGVSLSGETAERRQKPESPIGLIIESKPPASAQSTAPAGE